ncbi:protein dead ringer homolog [Sipha flava]|uniref:Protein dead ringer homolog n=1 Tax=Sipha flava TaxID=143950 RepID=A0A8B8FNF6_9HEMI|nr:protein dead ringer homolog [Sipha flava]
MKMTMDAAESARLGLNLNLSVQPQSYHWMQSPKGTDDEDEDDRRRADDDCSPEEEPDILEMQREERETLNQLARRLATGSHAGLMGGHATSMIQHLVYRHPNAMASSDQIVMPMSSRRSAVVDSPPGSSRSGDTPLGHEYPSENESSLLSRKGEAQSWTFEEQFRQLYTAGNETDRRSFLDSLFSYMQEQGTPISRLPIMAKRVLDLYTLYKLVVQRGGIVAVITKKLWQEIIRGLGLPPSITSAAFTLRTQYVKYLYAYESKMNRFSSVDELNMAIAGNRREGRRNKSLLSEYLPSLPVSATAGHHHHMSSAVASPGSHQQHQQQLQQQQQQQLQQKQQQQQQHYANVLAADDRFRHFAAVILDNRQRAATAAAAAAAAAEQQVRQQPLPSSSSSSPRPASPQRLGHIPSLAAAAAAAAATDASQFNGHLPPMPYQSASMIAAHQAAAVAGDHSNKQREILSMLMWMDLVRANQSAISRHSIPNLQPNTSPYNAAAVAAAMNLSPVVLQQKGPIPEQCEALNLGKKCQGTNNNNAGENDDEPTAKRIKSDYSPGGASAKLSRPASPKIKSLSPVRNSISPGRVSADENENDGDDRNSNMIEMEIDVSAGMSNGLNICVCKRTRDGIYKGQLVKVESSLNGGPKNTSSFILRLNGELYTGCLRLQDSILNHDDEKICS